MKIYGITIDYANPSPAQIYVSPYSDYKIGLDIKRNGTSLSAFTVKLGDQTLAPDETKTAQYTTFTRKSGAPGTNEYVISATGVSEKLKVKEIVTDSTVFYTDLQAPEGTATQEWVQDYVSTATSNKVTGAGVGQAPVVRAITAIYETPWATLSSNADANTFYVVLPDPVSTRVKYTAASGLPDWEGDIVGELTNSSIPNKSNIAEVEIGTHVTSIGANAFSWCSGLTSVTIPDSVTSIGGLAFFNCSGLTSVTIPDSVTSIGEEAFESCSSLTSVTIGNGVTSIGAGAFYSCGLASVTIPASVTTIGSVAFATCYNLTNVTFAGKTRAQVQGMTDYSWSLDSGCVIHCTDGDITIT